MRESRTILDSPFFSLVPEMVRLPDGTRTTYYRSGDEREGRPPLVAALAICRNAQGEIALSSQWSHPLRRVHGEFPAGGVLEDESLEAAVLRELCESADDTAKIDAITTTRLPRSERDPCRFRRVRSRMRCSRSTKAPTVV